jgi:hypothetical protein
LPIVCFINFPGLVTGADSAITLKRTGYSPEIVEKITDLTLFSFNANLIPFTWARRNSRITWRNRTELAPSKKTYLFSGAAG